MGKWILFIDGSSNFTRTCLRIILKSPQEDVLPLAVSCEPNATNNEAAYEAVIMGLELCKDLQIKDLQGYVDSLLRNNQFNGSYTVKVERLVPYLHLLKMLASEFTNFSLSQVPREDNAEEDALANLGCSLKIPLKTKIPIPCNDPNNRRSNQVSKRSHYP